MTRARSAIQMVMEKRPLHLFSRKLWNLLIARSFKGHLKISYSNCCFLKKVFIFLFIISLLRSYFYNCLSILLLFLYCYYCIFRVINRLILIIIGLIITIRSFINTQRVSISLIFNILLKIYKWKQKFPSAMMRIIFFKKIATQ